LGRTAGSGEDSASRYSTDQNVSLSWFARADKIEQTINEYHYLAEDRGPSTEPRIELILSALDDRDVLPDRDRELADLERLVGRGGYVAIVGGAYSGKSTLLAFFAANPPPDVDVVSFFVASPIRRNTTSLFVRYVNGQLRHLVADTGPATPDTVGRITDFERLWNAAVEQSQTKGRRLLLIVDGLDEQDNDDPYPPISSFLPPVTHEHVTVVVSCRPNPDSYVLTRPHPFDEALTRAYRLERTERIAARRGLAEHELDGVLGRASGGRRTARVLYGALGVLGAATRPMDVRSVAQILCRGKRDPAYEGDVAAYLAQSNLVRCVSGVAKPKLYELGHETFYDAVSKRIDLGGYCDMMWDWVAGYASRGWPTDTPRFILEEYPNMLDVDDLNELVTYEFRARVHASLGTEHHLAVAIRAAIAAHLFKKDSVSLGAVGELTLHRLDISSRRTNLPTNLVEAVIGAGNTDHAHRLADELPSPDGRVRMLTAVAKATANHHVREQRWSDAVQAATDLEEFRVAMLVGIAEANPPPGLRARLETATSKLDPTDRPQFLLTLANAYPDHRDRLLAAAQTAATKLDKRDRSRALVALATANPDDRDRLFAAAEAVAVSLPPEERDSPIWGQRAWALAEIADARPPTELLVRLEACAADLEVPGRHRVLVAIANAHPPAELRARLEVAARKLPPVEQAGVLAAIAAADPHGRDRILVAAEAVAASLEPGDRGDRSHALVAIANALPPTEVLDRLEVAAADLGVGGRANVLVAIANAHPPAELLARLEAAAADLPYPGNREDVLVAIANAHPPAELLTRLADAAISLHRDFGRDHGGEVLLAIAAADPPTDLLGSLEVAAADLGVNSRAKVLVAIANAQPPAELLARLEVAADKLPPAERARVLAALAAAYAPDRDRLFAAAETAAAGLAPEKLIWRLIAIADADPPAEVLTRLEVAAGKLPPVWQARVLAAVAGANPPDRDRLFAAAEAVGASLAPEKWTSELPGERAWLLAAIANAHPPTELLVRLEAATADLHPAGQAMVLTAIASANPPNLERLLANGEAATAKIHPSHRAALLEAIANAHPSTELLVRLEAAAAELPEDHFRPRARVLVAIAAASPPTGVLVRMEAAAASLHPADHAWVLAAIADTNPPNRDRLLTSAEAVLDRGFAEGSPVPALVGMAKASPADRDRLFSRAVVAAGQFFPGDSAEMLLEIASGGPPEALMARLEAAAHDTGPEYRTRVLAALADAYPHEHDRLLANAIAAMVTLDIAVLAKAAQRSPELWSLITRVSGLELV
jgi:tRNA-binding EMAP/Myf-like protein